MVVSVRGDDLEKAVASVIGDDPSDVDNQGIVLAEHLVRLSGGYGLSQHYDTELVDLAKPPAGVREMILHFLPECAHVEEKPDDLRDTLYRWVHKLSIESDIRSLFRKRYGRIATSEDLLDLAQQYWALSWSRETRPEFRFRLGPVTSYRSRLEVRSWIWDPGDGEKTTGQDLALLARTERLNRPGVSFTSGRGLRERGALLALLVARRIVAKSPELPPSSATVQPERVADDSDVRAADEALRELLAEVEVLRPMRSNFESQGKWQDVAGIDAAIASAIRRMSESRPDDYSAQLAWKYVHAGVSSARAGLRDRAREQFENASRVGQEMCEREPDEPQSSILHAFALTLLGMNDAQAGRSREAEGALARAVELFQHSFDRGGGDAADQGMFATVLTLLGMLYWQDNRNQRAEDALSRGRAMCERLVDDESVGPLGQFSLVSTLVSLGALYASEDRSRRAEETFAMARAIGAQLAAHNSHNPDIAIQQACVAVQLSSARSAEAMTAEDEAALAHAIDVVEHHLDPDTGSFRSQTVSDGQLRGILLIALHSRAAGRQVQGRSDDTAADYRAALEIFDGLDAAQQSQFAVFALDALHMLGNHERESGKTSTAEDAFERAVTMHWARRSDDPSDVANLAGLVYTLHALGELHLHKGQAVRSANELSVALQLLDELAREDPSDIPLGEATATVLSDLGLALSTQGQTAQATDALLRARDIAQRLSEEDPGDGDVAELLERVIERLVDLEGPSRPFR